jgi:hypothetical protein
MRHRHKRWSVEDVALCAQVTVEKLGYPAGAVISREEARKALIGVWYSSTEPNAFLDLALICLFQPESRWRQPRRSPDGLYRVF